jgi:hypothetical protein
MSEIRFLPSELLRAAKASTDRLTDELKNRIFGVAHRILANDSDPIE